MSTEPLANLLRSLGVKTCLLTDAEGAVLLRAGTSDSEADVLELQRMAATYAQSAEHAGKLGLGKNTTATAFYGALHCDVLLGGGGERQKIPKRTLDKGRARPLSLRRGRTLVRMHLLIPMPVHGLSVLFVPPIIYVSLCLHPAFFVLAFPSLQIRPLCFTLASRLSYSHCCSPRARTPTLAWCSTASRS